ncbi:MAG TPA: TonB-dependent receptor, partial [Niastella sp.]
TGFTTRTVEVEMEQNTRFNLVLSPIVLPEIQVNSFNMLKRDAGNKLETDQSGMYSNMLGETDPVRAVYLLPGNMESQESGGKLIVRGGEPGQSILLLDGNPVFNPAHLLGEISVVNNTSIRSLRQYKNDFPSKYSGGISSITAINTKDGNMQHWNGEAAIGFSSAAISVEGPLKKDRTALMASTRRSLGDAFNTDMFAYDALFSDLHLKLTHQINKNNKLLISGYTGKDRLQLTQDNTDYLQKWSNGLFTINWNLVTGKRSFANTTLNFNSFDNYVGMKYIVTTNNTLGLPITSNTVFNNFATGRRVEAKTAFELTASPYLQFQFGGRFEHAGIQPYTTLTTTEFVEKDDEIISPFHPLQELSFNNFSAWYENEIRIGNDILIRPGVHANLYSTNNYNDQSIQPRFFASYRLNNKQQIHFSYSHMGQWLHQVTSPYPGINREIWLPANERLLPALSKMINAGYQYKNSWVVNFSADIYYKQMTNLVNFAEKANVLFYNDSIEKNLITGKGKSYGIEIAAERKFKKWKTLLSYTLSWS